MAKDIFDTYLTGINEAYLRGDATEHTHRPALKRLIEALGDKITATNEPRQIACGAPDILVSRRKRKVDFRIGYIECKDIGKDLKKEERSEQIKKRYLPSLHNFILTDYIKFRWYTEGKLRANAALANEGEGGAFGATLTGKEELRELLRSFLEQEAEKVSSAKELAVRMGHIAQLLRDVTRNTFSKEQEEGPLHGQLDAFREVLIHDLTEEQFADMYAQTICYGLFTGRCHIEDMTIFGADKYAAFHGMNGKPGDFTRKDAAYLLPKTNPFLRKMFNHIAGPDLDDRIAWLVDDVVALLREAKMDVVLRDFARKKGRRDPVVHFYETFLAEYDPKLRKSRGVYYTPDAVVSYIVRSVDWLLKKKFGVRRGLADETKIQVDSRLRGNDKGGGNDKGSGNDKGEGKGNEVHKVLILDPAVGTGTFLFEVIDLIHRRFKKQKGMWSGYVRDHLLPRLFGFELMMAPYAIAHMKLGLELAETGYDFASDERLGIYLTNTLEEAAEVSKNVFVQWLSEEARAASKVKKDLPIMVVMGNPPYAGISANQGEWINNLLSAYREVDGEPLREKKIWVKNDYVKFVRFGQWRIEQTGQGILAFITDHSYLDSPTFRGMRRSLMNAFDEIYLLNLHGNAKRRETAPDGGKDENVFDILQGTVIGLFVKSPDRGRSSVFYGDLWGRRKSKYAALDQSDVKRTEWRRIEPFSPFYEFVPVDTVKNGEYERGSKVTDAFRVGSNGVQTSRDRLVVAIDRRMLKERFARIRNKNVEESTLRSELRIDDRSFWEFADARKELQVDSNWEECIRGYVYRPFDYEWLFASAKFVHRLRYEIMRHLCEANIGLCVGRAGLVASTEWDLVFCVNQICDHNLFYRGSSFNMPLYLYPNDGQVDMDYEQWPKGRDGRVPNLSREFVEELGRRIGLGFISDGRGDLGVGGKGPHVKRGAKCGGMDSRLRGNDKEGGNGKGGGGEKSSKGGKEIAAAAARPRNDGGTFGPEDVFDYIYGVFHSPEYRRRYAEFLKIDFPRVPWPAGRVIFREVAKVGGELVKLHLMEHAVLEDDKRWPGYPVEGGNEVEKGYPKYVCHADKADKGRVYINKDQYFEGVRQEVWEFHIGGYQVCEKWLKDRRGRELSYDDIRHYQRIVVALGETGRLMKSRCLVEMFD